MNGFAGCLFLSFFTTFNTLKPLSDSSNISFLILKASFSFSISNLANLLLFELCKNASKGLLSFKRFAFSVQYS